MRTTLDIEDDVLQAAKELARRDGDTASSEPSEQAQRSERRLAAGLTRAQTHTVQKNHAHRSSSTQSRSQTGAPGSAPRYAPIFQTRAGLTVMR